MVSVGYFLSCEEFGPRELVRQAQLAEQAGFERRDRARSSGR
jgi:hypothetical protein